MAIKIDIRKAFDTLSWDFLISVLSAFGFSSEFCSWIYRLLASARISILLNGSPKEYFSCSRGVRQGDPLSPLLFILAEEYLSALVAQSFAEGSLSAMSCGRILPPTHFLFADDTLIFCRATNGNTLALVRLFAKYSALSGQFINWSKSNIYFGRNMPPRESVGNM